MGSDGEEVALVLRDDEGRSLTHLGDDGGKVKPFIGD